MLNRIIIMGRMTRDPELRRTQSGIAVTSFRVAVDRDFRGPNGEQETDFIDVVAWRNQAEFVSKYFSRGRMIIVEGQLQIRDWTDKEGQKRRNAEIVADRIRFGESKRDADSEYGGSSGYSSGGSSSYASGYGGNSSPSYGGNSAPGYGGSNASGYGGSGAPSYGGSSTPGYGGSSASGFGGGNAPGYGAAPAPGYGSSQSDFAELSEEEDGDLPF